MIRGLYTAACGLLAARRGIAAMTNNVANPQTTGYKQDRVSLAAFGEQLIYNLATPQRQRSAHPPGTGE